MLYFSNIRTKGWVLIICKTKPLHIHLNRQHFNKWDEHIGTSGGKIQLAAFRFFWRQSLKVELPGERSALLSPGLVFMSLPCWVAQACWRRPHSVYSAVLVTLQMNGSGSISFSPLRPGFNPQCILTKNRFPVVVFFLFNKIHVAGKLSLIHFYFLVTKVLFNFCFKIEDWP